MKKENRKSKLENRLQLLRSIKEPIYEVEPELIEQAREEAQLWIERWKHRHPSRHWTEGEERNIFVGILGQMILKIVFQQFEIFHVYNEPIIEEFWRTKSYDFKTLIGTIEVKTVDYHANQKRVIIKREEWHGSDYVIAVKLLDKKPTKAILCGYATKNDVEKEFIYAENEFPCRKKPCYWQFLDKLRPIQEILQKLVEIAN